jgi:transposase InsO family protein
LKVYNFILRKSHKKNYGWVHRYSNEDYVPDELWQTDITYLRYQNKDVYQLSFIDVFSRYIVLSVTLLNMTSSTVSDVFEKYIEKNKDKLKRIPIIQSDNGSPYIGKEFQQVIQKFNFTHNRIHPGTPTENVIIER